jgi:hypothetical protein
MSDGPKVVAVRYAIIDAIKDGREWTQNTPLIVPAQLLYEFCDSPINAMPTTMQADWLLS